MAFYVTCYGVLYHLTRRFIIVVTFHYYCGVFFKGWRSVYVNEPGEVLAWCTHQPSSLTWRIKQVLRWHQGAVQLLLFKGIRYTSFGGHFPTLWHRLYAFDQATYYLQVTFVTVVLKHVTVSCSGCNGRLM